MDNAIFHKAALLMSLVLLVLLATPTLAAPFRDNSLQCGLTSETFRKFYMYWRDYVSPAFYLYIPFLIIVTLNTLLYFRLRADRRRRSTLAASGRNKDVCRLKQQKLAEKMTNLMLVVTSLAFLVLTLPLCIFYIAGFRQHAVQSNPTVFVYTMRLFQIVSHLLADSTHAINFLLYSLTNRRFRHYAMELLVKFLVKLRLKSGKTGAYSFSETTSLRSNKKQDQHSEDSPRQRESKVLCTSHGRETFSETNI